jgi:hypothetical protein
VFEKRADEDFEPSRSKITSNLRYLHNELNNLHSLRNIVGAMK